MSISTLTLNNANRATLMRLQTELKDATKELNTERHADVGLSIGRLTGTAVNYRVQETSIDAQLETNKVITARLDLAEDGMSATAATGETLTGSLLSAQAFTDFPALAKSALQQMQGTLNTSVGGLYVFGGENAGVAPIGSVDDGIAAARAKYDIFLSAIDKTGHPELVTADEMAGFVSADGYLVPAGFTGAGQTLRFMDTVDDPAWGANWSSASANETAAAISKTETIQTSVSANAKAFRNVAAAYSMLAAIPANELGESARVALTQASAITLKAGLDGITTLRAAVGTRQARVEAADKALTRQKDVVNAAFTRLEGVDQTEAGLRVTQLETQLQASYTVTGRLQRLSILDYI